METENSNKVMKQGTNSLIKQMLIEILSRGTQKPLGESERGE